MPKVSVIIPTFNRAEFLPTAIASVLNQTFQDFELMVVDDASTDNTSDVVSGFHDERIKYICHEVNKGGSTARNTGILNTKSEYIAFLDDDDEWFPDKLRRQMDTIQTSPQEVGGVYTGYVIVDRASGKFCGQKIPQKTGDLSKDLLLSNCIGGTSVMLLRKKCFDKVGLFDESLPSFQDYDLWLRLSKEFQFAAITDPLAKYYHHPTKTWTNLDTISKGSELMLHKYGQSPVVRKHFAYSYLSLGVQYCNEGNIKQSRKAFLKAMRLYPFEIRHYFNFCLSLFGAENFRRAKKALGQIHGLL